MNEELKWKIGETYNIVARKHNVVKLKEEDEPVRENDRVIRIKRKSDPEIKERRYTFFKRSGSQGYEFIGRLKLSCGDTTKPKFRQWVSEKGLEGTKIEIGKIFNDLEECCRAREISPPKGHLQSAKYKDLWFPREGNEAYSNEYDKESGTLKEYVANRDFFEKTSDGDKYLGRFKFVDIKDNASIWELDMNDDNDMPISESEKNALSSLLENNLQLILTGAPGTGKTFMAWQLAAKMIGCKEDELGSNSQFKFVQFHPGYDYSDFVIGLKPKLDKESKQVTFEWKDGIFKKFCDAAKEDSGKNYVMVIDEINRADLSRVFGELFFCLEETYRGKEITLPNETDSEQDKTGNNKFTIPKNVYIIGTMNDIDRSVESMDFALRRRFAWHEVKAEDTGEEIIGTADVSDVVRDVSAQKMKAVNDKLKALKFGEEYKLGGAYFKKIEKYKDNPEKMWESLWDNHIAVILREYLRGRRNADEILKSLKECFDEGKSPEERANASTPSTEAGAENN